jgi:hypothetical protein
MQETGVNWSVIPHKHQWMERSKQYFEPNTSKISFGFNRHNKTKSPRQWGGTGIFTRGKLIHFSMGTGMDEKGLGRWTWARYRGRQGIVLRVVSIYQPCNSQGPTLVHEQQRCYLQQTHEDRPVRLAFREDFADALASWLHAGGPNHCWWRCKRIRVPSVYFGHLPGTCFLQRHLRQAPFPHSQKDIFYVQ